jgi:hypothetical protein
MEGKCQLEVWGGGANGQIEVVFEVIAEVVVEVVVEVARHALHRPQAPLQQQIARLLEHGSK